MRFRFWVALTIWIGVAGSCLSFSQVGPAPSTVAELHLETYGWENPPLPLRDVWPGRGGPTVAIDHQNRVLAGFVTKNPGLEKRGAPWYSFHILRFTPDGKLDLSLAIPTNSWFTSGFYLGPDDRLLVRANDEIQMKIDEDLKAEGAAWTRLAPCPKECYVSQSPSRKTLILLEGHTRLRLDASAPVTDMLGSCPQHAGSNITDNYGYASGSSYGMEYYAHRWTLCQPGAVADLPVNIRGGQLLPLTDQFLLVFGADVNSTIEGVNIDGQVRFTQKMAKHDLVWPYSLTGEILRPDESADRFAFLVETWRGGSRFLDISGHPVAQKIEIYSDAGQKLGELSVKVPFRRDFDYALSPDGHWLAAHEGDIVQIVKID
jgi:hypothetical protein